MINVYAKLLDLLLPEERRKFFILLGLVFVLAIFEALSVVSILPFLQVVSNPELIHTQPILSWVYEKGGFSSDRSFMIWMGFTVFVFTVVGLAFKAAMVWILTRFAMMRSYSFSSRLLSGYLRQPYSWFLNRHTAELGQGILSEVDQMVANVLLSSLHLIPDFLTSAMLITAMMIFEPEVALSAAILLGGAYGLIYAVIRRMLLRIGDIRAETNKSRFHTVQEAMGGVKELKLMGLEDRFLRRFQDAAYKMARAQTTGLVVRQVPRYALEALAFGGMILLILVLILRDNGGLETLLPTIGLIAVLGMRMIPALQQVYMRISNIRFHKPTLDRIHEDLMNASLEHHERRAKSEHLPRRNVTDQIEIRDLFYSYPNTTRSALHGLSMNIKANTTIGIVGGTGAGKTTLIDVILGLLEPDDGALIVDGEEIVPENIRRWQKSIGYVPQQIFLSDSSVAENIAFGFSPEDIDMEQVERAARIAALHDFVVSEMPDGYDSIVGERGLRLSGGQRQRIGIARALYNDPDVLILDEATSALDNLTEQAVMDAVDALAGSKTVIMIAHRLSTIENCDQIFLLRNGAVGAQGTYRELIEKDAEFRAMAKA